jgi:N-acetylglucosamine-6-phosphate deacetylase
MIPSSPEGEVVARHFATGATVKVRWRDGVITHLEPSSEKLQEVVWIAPSLFDLQVNGYGGVDFQQDNLRIEDLKKAAGSLWRDGCARFFVTLITDEWAALTSRLKHLRSLRSQSSELQKAIVGWHVEGPFLCEQPGFHGAHNPGFMSDPTPEHILELGAITGNDPLLLTVAPERAGAIEAIRLAVSRGIKVSLGHTNASAEILAAAVRAGATGFTHLANGCPRELDRHDNILWRVFETPGLSVSLIPDQIHVSPTLFRLIHRTLGSDAIYYTSDAMSAAGGPPGRYRLGKMELEVGADQVVRQPGKSLFAGSALRPIDGVFRAARMLDCAWQKVWGRFSSSPARLMGLENELGVGGAADFCLLRQNELLDLETSGLRRHKS